MIWLWTLAWGVAGTAAGLMVPVRMRLMLPVVSTQSASEVVIPFGHWIVVAIWAAGALWWARGERRAVLLRCIGVGLAWHVLILLALFVPRLSDREAFSASIYLIYAQLFAAGAIALGVAWLSHWIARVRSDAPTLTILETALLPAWLGLVAAVLRYNVAMAAMAVIAGGAVAVFVRTRAAARLLAVAGDDRVFVPAVFLVALGMRLLYITRIMSDANYLDAGSDGRAYDEIAWSIANGNGAPSWYTNRFPLLLLGYVHFVAFVYAMAGRSYFAITAVQAVLGAAACVLMYDLARRLLDRAVARVTAVFMAVSFPLVFAAATIGHQALDVFLTVLVIWMAVRIAGSKAAPWRWAVLGIAAGLSMVVRETAAFLAAFLAAWIAFANPSGWKRSWPRVAAFVAGLVVIALPFVAPKVWTASDRQAMLGHFDRLYRVGVEGEIRETPRTDIIGPLADPAGALAQLRAEPAHVAGTLARAYATNVAVQFLTQPYGGFDLVFLRKGTEYYYAMWFYAYALTVAGAIVLVSGMRSGRTSTAGALLILGVIAARTFPHVILESGYRHRVPVEPFLIMLASVGAMALYRAAMATPASVRTSGFTGSDWRVSHSSGT